jgi:hypothetical protein
MSFDRCPVCLSKKNGPFFCIRPFAYSDTRFGIAAVNEDGDPCCSIGHSFGSWADAETEAANCDRLEIEAESEAEAAMYDDGGDYGPADSDPYDCERYGY